LADLAQALVEIARQGLIDLDPMDEPLLEPLRELASQGRSPAEDVLEAWEREPDPVKLFDRFAP